MCVVWHVENDVFHAKENAKWGNVYLQTILLYITAGGTILLELYFLWVLKRKSCWKRCSSNLTINIVVGASCVGKENHKKQGNGFPLTGMWNDGKLSRECIEYFICSACGWFYTLTDILHLFVQDDVLNFDMIDLE